MDTGILREESGKLSFSRVASALILVVLLTAWLWIGFGIAYREWAWSDFQSWFAFGHGTLLAGVLGKLGADYRESRRGGDG